MIDAEVRKSLKTYTQKVEEIKFAYLQFESNVFMMGNPLV